MTKEELQTELTNAEATNELLRQKVKELEDTLAAQIRNHEACDSMKTILEGDLKAANAKIAELENIVNNDETPKQLKTACEIIRTSCADHCPYHRAPDACRNCSINKTIEEAGLPVDK